MTRGAGHDDEHEAERDAGEAPSVPAQVADQLERARGQVFEAYVRSRERARELASADPADE